MPSTAQQSLLAMKSNGAAHITASTLSLPKISLSTATAGEALSDEPPTTLFEPPSDAETELERRREAQFGTLLSRNHLYVSQHPGGPLDPPVIDEPPYYYFLATYISYLLLIAIGHTRDFFGRHFKKGTTSTFRLKSGYAPLNDDFDNFYVRRLKRRLDNCFARPTTGVPGRFITLIDRKSDDYNLTYKFTGTFTETLNMSSYNYLGFAQSDGPCADAAEDALRRCGISACSPRADSGTSDLALEVEREVAAFVGKPAAMVFSMGFVTNASSFPALVSKGCLILSDELNHASIRIGARLSGALIRSFKHNDMADLERHLRDAIAQGQPRTHRPWKKILVAVEGLYSMEGTMVDLPNILALKRKYKFFLFLDEAHSIGAVGRQGRGVCDYFRVDPAEVDILMGTFTKSFGANGGYVSAEKYIIDKLKATNAATQFGESPAPAVLMQILSALKVIAGEVLPGQGEERLQRIAFNSRYLRLGLKRLGFIVYGHDDSPIIPLVLYSPGKMAAFSNEMLKRNIAVVIVGYPATPLISSRARFCISASHTKEDMDRMLIACDEVGEMLQLKFSTGIAGGLEPLPAGVTPEMERELLREQGRKAIANPPRWKVEDVIAMGENDVKGRLRGDDDDDDLPIRRPSKMSRKHSKQDSSWPVARPSVRNQSASASSSSSASSSPAPRSRPAATHSSPSAAVSARRVLRVSDDDDDDVSAGGNETDNTVDGTPLPSQSSTGPVKDSKPSTVIVIDSDEQESEDQDVRPAKRRRLGRQARTTGASDRRGSNGSDDDPVAATPRSSHAARSRLVQATPTKQVLLRASARSARKSGPRSARQRHMELLRRRRAGEKVTESDLEQPSSDDEQPHVALYDKDPDHVALSEFEDDDEDDGEDENKDAEQQAQEQGFRKDKQKESASDERLASPRPSEAGKHERREKRAKQKGEKRHRKRQEEQNQLDRMMQLTSKYDDDGDEDDGYDNGYGYEEEEPGSPLHESGENNDDMADFIDDSHAGPLGAPGDGGADEDEQAMLRREIPLQFTFQAHKPLKSHFKDAVEWLVHRAVHPAGQFADRDDELYKVAWARLDREVGGLAQSRFISSSWTPEFYSTLRARPYMDSFDMRPAGHGGGGRGRSGGGSAAPLMMPGLDGNVCHACGRTNHPASFRVLFSGKAYDSTTLEEVEGNDDEDDDDDDNASLDMHGYALPPTSRPWYVGTVCHSNAETAHDLLHWRRALQDWVAEKLAADGVPDRLARKPKRFAKAHKRAALVNTVVDEWEANGTISSLFREFTKMLETAQAKSTKTLSRYGR
ncbi:serine palmitoyltransferase [Niveomyces insectorum RCEF 264]|uniref:Serine palmitoyltransferase n=1 Tax=Niveomyces insectorum RCEF 264 TaxID=1081102 RepID=A0A167NHE8_9HYPO|nr:serine palmitoyltransferase [Niveomyces insectorum RCEF 264]